MSSIKKATTAEPKVIVITAEDKKIKLGKRLALIERRMVARRNRLTRLDNVLGSMYSKIKEENGERDFIAFNRYTRSFELFSMKGGKIKIARDLGNNAQKIANIMPLTPILSGTFPELYGIIRGMQCKVENDKNIFYEYLRRYIDVIFASRTSRIFQCVINNRTYLYNYYNGEMLLAYPQKLEGFNL